MIVPDAESFSCTTQPVHEEGDGAGDACGVPSTIEAGSVPDYASVIGHYTWFLVHVTRSSQVLEWGFLCKLEHYSVRPSKHTSCTEKCENRK
jgi:hypothetical protein